MTTSDSSSTAPPARTPLRLRIVESVGRDALDGGWWPHSRDLDVELADLAQHFPSALGAITRVVFSPPDWDVAPPRITVAGRVVDTSPFQHDDPHQVELTTTTGTTLRLLVVPPSMTDAQGDEALLAASTPGYSHSPSSLLDTVSEFPDVDPDDHWTDSAP